jgi:hypothetical protein
MDLMRPASAHRLSELTWTLSILTAVPILTQGIFLSDVWGDGSFKYAAAKKVTFW